jgi:hypothetical protein
MKTVHVDIETIIICAVMAISGSIGILTGGAAFAGIRFSECNHAVLAGVGCTLSGLLWGILLIANGKNWMKNI